MYLESYPTTKDWHKEIYFKDASVASHFATQNLIFLYIRNDADLVQYISDDFRSGVYAEGLSKARQILNQMLLNESHLPDAIIFDVPLNEKQLIEFCGYLKSKSQLSVIPLLYNQKHIDVEKGKYLRKNELIDDVINIHHREINYVKKISFLKKIKSQNVGLQLSADFPKHIRKPQISKLSFKRIFDFVFSLSIILLCSPLFILVAIAIKLESKGPVFYTSLRAGKGFKIFRFYKFRTMGLDADKKIEALAHLNQYEKGDNGVRFLKIYNDPRVTKVGKILRRISLDELPQLFNVLKGDMSLVGNRPLPIYEANTLTTNEFVERFMAPAGITGLWQITKKKKPDMSAEERINLDISYARQYNLIFDFKIIAKTPGALFQKNNS